jgi:hypothetical protein
MICSSSVNLYAMARDVVGAISGRRCRAGTSTTDTTSFATLLPEQASSHSVYLQDVGEIQAVAATHAAAALMHGYR